MKGGAHRSTWPWLFSPFLHGLLYVSQVALMYSCTLEEFRQRMLTWKPNLVYINAGIQVKGTGDNAHDIVLKPIAFAPATAGGARTRLIACAACKRFTLRALRCYRWRVCAEL